MSTGLYTANAPEPGRPPPCPVPRSGFSGIHWPALPSPTEALIHSLLWQFESSQWWRPEVLLGYQLHQLTALVAFAAERVPFHRERLAPFAKPTRPLTVDEWRTIPTIARTALKDLGPEMLAVPPPEGHGKPLEVATSGSTGVPVKVRWSEAARIVFSALTFRNHLWCERDFAAKLASIRLLEAETAHRVAIGGKARWAPGFPSGPAVFLDVAEPVDAALEWLIREDPVYLSTYPTYLDALIARSLERGMRPASLREVATSGEPVDDHTRRACSEHWGAAVQDTYSTQEVGIIALEIPGIPGYLVQSEGILVEVLDDQGAQCDVGEVGRVVLTPLHNFAMPLIRYDIGDYAEVGPPSPCGRGLPVLTRIAGRVRNMVRLPNGDMHWPTTSAFIDHDFISQYQIVQTSLQNLEVKLVVTRPPGVDGEASMTAALAKDMRHPFEVAYTYLDDIPRAASGKFEGFISKVADKR